MAAKITVADVRRDPAAANQAYLDGATLHVPFGDALEVWRSLDSIDLSNGLKSELGLAGQELALLGGSTSVPAERVEQLRSSVGDGREDRAKAAPAFGFPWAVAGAVAGAVLLAGAVVVVGFGAGFVYGLVTGGDDDGAVDVADEGDGGATVTRDPGNPAQ